VQTSAPIPVPTHAPIPVPTHAPIPMPTHAPTSVQTHAPTSVPTHAPTSVQTHAPTPVQTSAPIPVQTHAPIRVQTSAPIPVQSHAPIPVSTTIHSTPSSSHTTNYNIVISPHIKIIIQNIKYSQKHSYTHINNLLRKLKMYHDDFEIYRQLLHTRYHLHTHYNTILRDLHHLLDDNNDRYNDNDPTTPDTNHKYIKKTPHFIHSMHLLDESIKRIEHSLQFIKGNHKFILLNILHKLKLQYHTDTSRLLDKWNNNFV